MAEAPELSNIKPVVKVQVTNDTRLSCLLDDDNEIVKPPITIRHLKEPLDGFILFDVLSKSECERLVTRSEELKYSFWNLANPEEKKFRNADTVEVEDKNLADRIWQRVKTFINCTVDIHEDDPRCDRGVEGQWKAQGVNSNLLFARYEPGGHFSPHTDGYTILDFNTRTLYSCLLYLNTCNDGGATRLMAGKGGQKFVVDNAGRFRWPEDLVLDEAKVTAGSMLVFSQHLMHEGQPVGEGKEKYIIRTDIVYERVEKLLTAPNDVEAYKLFREAELLEADGEITKAVKMFQKCCKLSPSLADIFGI